MKIYTKTGDEGETGLFGGGRVPKDDPRVAVYGTVDELNAALGLVRSAASSDETAELESLQSDLFVIGAELATAPGNTDKLRLRLIEASDIERLERWIDRVDAELPALTSFVLPGGSDVAARLHVARAVCRRAEREFYGVARSGDYRPEIGVYLNRLSDLLFVLARRSNRLANVDDVPWQARK